MGVYDQGRPNHFGQRLRAFEQHVLELLHVGKRVHRRGSAVAIVAEKLPARGNARPVVEGTNGKVVSGFLADHPIALAPLRIALEEPVVEVLLDQVGDFPRLEL